jgi:hypothetical protein
MVASAARVHRPRLGIQTALAERWQSAIDELHRVAPGVPYGQPISEMNLDHLHDLIEKHRKVNASPEPAPELRAAWQEIYQIKVQFNGDAIKLKQSAWWLDGARRDWRHILRKLSPDCWTPAPGVFPTDTRSSDLYPNVEAAREAAKALIARRAWLRAIVSEIEGAKSFETWSHGEQAFELCRALFNENVALKTRVTALEGAYMAAQARLDRLERGNQPKMSEKSKTRSTPNTKRK